MEVTKETGTLDLRSLKDAVKAIEAARTPFLALPPELILEVFKTAVFEASISPFTLGTICRSFRNLALVTPALWTKIKHFAFYDIPQRLQIFEVWMERAGSLPLSISVQPFSDAVSEEEVDTAEIQGLINHIFAKSAQVASLDLILPGAFFDEWAHREPVPQFPILTHLRVDSQSHSLHSFTLDLPRLDFRWSSALKSVRITELYTMYLVLPWSSIVDLRLDHPTVSEIRDALSSAPNLVTLFVEEVIDHDHRDPGSTWVISSTSLRQLTVSGMEEYPPESACKMLHFLHLPGLESLTFLVANSNRGVSDVEKPWLNVYPVLSKWKCPLVELTLGRGTIRQPTFINCLKLLPSLRHLGIVDVTWVSDPPGDDPSFAASSQKDLYACLAAQPETLLSKLESLTVECGAQGCTEGTRASILELLLCRGGAGGVLRKAVTKGVFVDKLPEMEYRMKKEMEEDSGMSLFLN